MWSPKSLVGIVSLTIPLIASATSVPFERNLRYRREIITPDELAESYDFVIAGGGVAGLVLAARLTEYSDNTVLVLEAGDTGDDVKNTIDPPAAAYYISLLNTPYDWSYQTSPQNNAGDRPLGWPRGKVLGGSSALNGMYWIRPSEIEYEAWRELIAQDDAQAAETWGWSNFFETAKKVENFATPSQDNQEGIGLLYNVDHHGTSGPVHATYPGFFINTIADWIPSLEAAGVPGNSDAYNGLNIGAYIAQSSINPSNWTRSYAKSAYIDPLPPRPNLHILVSSTVTRLIFASGSSKRVSAVEFASSADAQKRVIKVDREVILSGGAVGSPQILMVSGIGPKDVLEEAGVDVRVDLPGVGQHIQDHMTVGVTWETDSETAGDIRNRGGEFSESAYFLSFINSAVAYINNTVLFGSQQDASNFHQEVTNAFDSSVENLVPSTNPEVIEGYKAIYKIISEKFIPSELGSIELLLGTNAPGTITIQVANQHPLSQGRLYITTPDVFDYPTIDPNYLSHPADVAVIRQGLKLIRSLGTQRPISGKLKREVSPGRNVRTDEELEDWLRNQTTSQYHPIGTCAMMPKELGGVVDAKLRVYGLDNVRVIDSSVFPFSLATHIASATFTMSEQAVEVIQRDLSPKVAASGTGPSVSSSARALLPSLFIAFASAAAFWLL